VKYRIRLIAEAEDDLFDIYQYVALADSPLKAESLIGQLEETCQKLAQFPERGHTPQELKHIDVLDYREILCFSYKIIYQIIGQNVYVHCILDGRRDLQDILQRRLLR